MLIPTEELRFDFKGAAFDLKSESDRKFLGWVFNQFLYGEVTGIQCGYWLYRAPHLSAATFLARQASEELSHVRRISRILGLLREQPARAHWAVRLLSTGMMGHSWGEHVALEMALGEGLVLAVFYALAETIADPEIKKILVSALKEEERHVEFGERETLDWIKRHPESRELLLTLAWIQVWVLKRFRSSISKRISSRFSNSHPVMSQFDEFYLHVLRSFEKRMERLGLSSVPVSQLGVCQRCALIAFLPFRMLMNKLRIRAPLLTRTYLQDPVLSTEHGEALPLSEGHK